MELKPTQLQKGKKRTISIIDETNPAISIDSPSSFSNNDSNIQRCNIHLAKNTSPIITNIEEEVSKTIEVGCLVGFNMGGFENDVHKIIGDDNVIQ